MLYVAFQHLTPTLDPLAGWEFRKNDSEMTRNPDQITGPPPPGTRVPENGPADSSRFGGLGGLRPVGNIPSTTENFVLRWPPKGEDGMLIMFFYASLVFSNTC